MIAYVLIGLGCFFMVSGALGIVRLPDFYTRLHPAGVTDSLGGPLVLLGIACLHGVSLYSGKLILLVLLLWLTGPTATHLAAKTAHVSGLKPYTNDQEELSGD